MKEFNFYLNSRSVLGMLMQEETHKERLHELIWGKETAVNEYAKDKHVVMYSNKSGHSTSFYCASYWENAVFELKNTHPTRLIIIDYVESSYEDIASDLLNKLKECEHMLLQASKKTKDNPLECCVKAFSKNGVPVIGFKLGIYNIYAEYNSQLENDVDTLMAYSYLIECFEAYREEDCKIDGEITFSFFGAMADKYKTDEIKRFNEEIKKINCAIIEEEGRCFIENALQVLKMVKDKRSDEEILNTIEMDLDLFEKLKSGELYSFDCHIKDFCNYFIDYFEIISSNYYASKKAIRKCIEEGRIKGALIAAEEELVSQLMFEGIVYDYLQYVILLSKNALGKKICEMINKIRFDLNVGLEISDIVKRIDMSEQFVEKIKKCI